MDPHTIGKILEWDKLWHDSGYFCSNSKKQASQKSKKYEKAYKKQFTLVFKNINTLKSEIPFQGYWAKVSRPGSPDFDS